MLHIGLRGRADGVEGLELMSHRARVTVGKRSIPAVLAAAAMCAGLLIVTGQAPAAVADHVAVTDVDGSAFGVVASVALLGGPPSVRPCTTLSDPTTCGPTPSVTLPLNGSAVPITATVPSTHVQIGSAVIFSSGPVATSTVGTTANRGSTISSADITTVNTSMTEVFTAARLSSGCSADSAGRGGGTTVVDGMITTSQGEDPGDPADDTVVAVPTNPARNTAITVENRGENLRYVFNEQIDNADGSITINALHAYLLGPTAVGDVIAGQSVCGVTTDEVTDDERFVIAVYGQVLGRDVDEGGLNFWAGELGDGFPRAQFVLSVVASAEGRSLACEALYQVFLDRSADPGGAANCASLLAGGQRYIDVAAFLAGSLEYLAANGGTNSGFLEAVYLDAVGRPIDAGARPFWLQRLTAGESRQSVARSILASDEGFGLVVDAVYDVVFDRVPDPGGRAFWIGQLQAGATEELLIAQIAGSEEAYARAASGQAFESGVVDAAVIGD